MNYNKYPYWQINIFRGIIKVEDIFYYLKYKDKFVKSSKRKDYQEAIQEIESDIEKDGTDGNKDSALDETVSL